MLSETLGTWEYLIDRQLLARYAVVPGLGHSLIQTLLFRNWKLSELERETGSGCADPEHAVRIDDLQCWQDGLSTTSIHISKP